MNQWQNGQADGLFHQQTLNPSMFSNLNTSGQFDLNGVSAFQQQQQQQGPANGSQTPTSTTYSQTFQPGSVVPQKRPHDGGMSGSPAPPPPAQITRSQTPNYNAFATQQQAGQQFSQAATPSLFAHLQQPGSAQATPSPTLQNQHFRQPSRMSNASPNPFPQAQANFPNQMNAQDMGQQNQMAQQGQQMAALAQQYGMNMTGQAGNPNNALAFQQRQYQQRLMQQQATMRAQNGRAAANPAYNMSQMQAAAALQNGQANNLAMQQQHQMKRQQFLQQCSAYVAKSGQAFNASPSVSGKPLDLYFLFTVVVHGGGSGAIERTGQWQQVAHKMGFNQAQYPGAAEEIKSIFIASVALYEKAWMTAKASQKQEQARMHAQQMAGGFGTPTQASPTKTMQPPLQTPNQQTFNQFQQSPHQQQQQTTPQPTAQVTPLQAHASLPQNGISTPQPMPGLHQRNSSMKKQETPQASMPVPSPRAPVSRQNPARSGYH